MRLKYNTDHSNETEEERAKRLRHNEQGRKSYAKRELEKLIEEWEPEFRDDERVMC